MASKKTLFIVNYYAFKSVASVFNLISSITELFIPSQKFRLPPVNNSLLLLDSQTLSNSIKKLEIKCEDVIQAYIDRIKKVNPLINAVNDSRFENALKEASKIDKDIKYEIENGFPPSGQESLLNKPLLGVPLSAKNSIFIKNLVTDSGLVARKNCRASENSSVVDNLNKAGAILIALTNVPELLIWYDSNNKVHGRTNNPYDLSRIPGGSSGGEAALISSAGSLGGIGSDIGGSIRMPSFFCGVWGHFPTPGIVPIEGMYPPIAHSWKNSFAFGPICRYASDIKPLLEGMAGDNAKKLSLDKMVDFSKIKIFYIKNDGNNPLSSPIHPEIHSTIFKAISHFKTKYNTKVEVIEYQKLKFTFPLWGALISSGDSLPLAVEAEARNGRMKPFIELIKYFFFLSNHTLPIILLTCLEAISPKKNSSISKRALEEGNKLRNFFLTLLNEKGVIFYPTHPIPAIKHETTILHGINCQYTMLSNLLGFPTTHCPMGLTKDNLPIGFQIITSPFKDRYSIAMANELNDVFGGCKPPFEVNC